MSAVGSRYNAPYFSTFSTLLEQRTPGSSFITMTSKFFLKKVKFYYLLVRVLADQQYGVEDDVVPDAVAGVLKHVEHGVDQPALVGRVLLGRDDQVGGALLLELRLCRLEKHQQLLHHRLDVGPVDQGKAELHRALLNGHVTVL